jgi:hypothetical protein
VNEVGTNGDILDNESTFGEQTVNPRDLYSLRDAAKLIGVSNTIVWLWVNANKLPSVRIGNSRAVNITDARKVNAEMMKLSQSVKRRSPARIAGMM